MVLNEYTGAIIPEYSTNDCIVLYEMFVRTIVGNDWPEEKLVGESVSHLADNWQTPPNG